MTEPWFDPAKFGALYGGIGGGVLGALGGTLGALAGWLAPRGEGRSFVLGGFTLVFGLGAAHLVLGLYAVFMGQPYGIWYPLVLIGAIATGVFGFLRPVIRKRYEEAEMRRTAIGSLGRG